MCTISHAQWQDQLLKEALPLLNVNRNTSLEDLKRQLLGVAGWLENQLKVEAFDEVVFCSYVERNLFYEDTAEKMLSLVRRAVSRV